MPDRPIFPFMDLATGARWTVRPNAGRLPWWVLARGRRVPGTRARDYLGLLALRRPAPDATVARALKAGALFDRLLAPLAIAALNTPPEEGSAALLGAVVGETLLRGGAACIPAFPRDGLSECFVDPALDRLRARGADDPARPPRRWPGRRRWPRHQPRHARWPDPGAARSTRWCSPSRRRSRPICCPA